MLVLWGATPVMAQTEVKMGASGWSVVFKPMRENADVAALPGLQRTVWEQVMRTMRRYTNSAENQSIWRGYLDGYAPYAFQEAWFSVSGLEMRFSFRDASGDHPRSRAVAEYWSRLAFAASLEQIESRTMDEGWAFDVPRPQLRALLRIPGGAKGPRFIALRGDLWTIHDDGRLSLIGDGEVLGWDALTVEEQQQVQRGCDAEASQDQMTRMLTPDEAFASSLVALMGAEVRAQQEAALFYAAMTAYPTPQMIAAALEIGLEDAASSASRRTYTLGYRAPDASLPVLQAALKSPTAGQRALAIAALAGFAATPDRSVDANAARREAVLAGLQDDDPANEVAAEHLTALTGDVSVEDLTETVLAALAREGLSDGFRHALVLTLVNLYLRAPRVPRAVMQVFEAHQEASGTLAGLAQWAIQVFGGRVGR